MVHFRYPLLPFLASYVAGLWIVREVFAVSPALAYSVLALLACIAIFLSIRRRDSTLLLLLLGVLIGCGRMGLIERERAVAERAVEHLDDQRLHHATGVISAIQERLSGRVQITLKNVTVTSGTQSIRPGKLFLTAPSDKPFSIGQSIRFASTIKPPPSFSNFGAFDYRRHLANSNIFATGFVASGSLIETVDEKPNLHGAFAAMMQRFRKYCSEKLSQYLPPKESRLTICMLFNDMSLMDREEQRVFRDSGTMHLFAVSGLHIAVVTAVLIILLRLMRFSIRASWTGAVILLFAYVVLLDFIPPVFRAWLMAASFALGWWMKREVDGISRMLFGFTIILVSDPSALWGASFILSAMGVAALVVFSPIMGQWIPRTHPTDMFPGAKIKTWVFEAVTMIVAITLILLPLQFFYFQQMSLLSPLANVLEAGLSGPVLCAAAATIAAGSFNDVAGMLFGSATALIMRLVYLIAELTANVRQAIVCLPAPPFAAVLAYYFVLLSGYYLVRRGTPEFGAKSRARIVLHLLGAVGAFLAIGAMANHHRDLRVWFLDVGQGDSTLIRFPSGKSMLIDTGNIQPDIGRLVVEPVLKRLGVRPLGTMVLTHADADHIGGARWVLRNLPTRECVVPTGDENSSDTMMQSTLSTARETGSGIIPVAAGERIPIERGIDLEILNPIHGSTAVDNDRSVIIRLTHGKSVFLFTGDAGKAVEQTLVSSGIGHVDVLKAGHHGSDTSSDASFLAATSPQIAVISCGLRNRYGHPHPGVIQRLAEAGTQIYRTDLHGGVLIRSDGNCLKVTISRRQKRIPFLD